MVICRHNMEDVEMYDNTYVLQRLLPALVAGKVCREDRRWHRLL